MSFQLPYSMIVKFRRNITENSFMKKGSLEENKDNSAKTGLVICVEEGKAVDKKKKKKDKGDDETKDKKKKKENKAEMREDLDTTVVLLPSQLLHF